MPYSMRRIVCLLAAAILVIEITVSDNIQLSNEKTEVQIHEIIAEAIINERIGLERFSATVEPALRDAIRIFHLRTPITEIPKLIQDFADRIDTSRSLQYFAQYIKPAHAVHLFDRLLQSTTFCVPYRKTIGIFQ